MSDSRTPEQQVIDALPLTPEDRDWIEHHRYTRMPPKGEAMPDKSLEKLMPDELLKRYFYADPGMFTGKRELATEIIRRLKRLEKCEAALGCYERAHDNAAYQGGLSVKCRCATCNEARAALDGK